MLKPSKGPARPVIRDRAGRPIPLPPPRPAHLEPPPPGAVLWEGPSRLTGAPIVAVMTFRSENQKTGPMLQTWILRTDMGPIEASQSGADDAICGACPLRGQSDGSHAKGRACYVNLISGPRQIYLSYRSGLYPPLSDLLLARHVAARPLRLGSYGDPVAVPLGVWTRLLSYASGHTGYTSQWGRPDAQDYRPLLMASVRSEAERCRARGLGWRTYRSRRADEAPTPGEVLCPASPEGGYRRTCDQCMACDGAGRPGQSDVTVIAHGGIGSLRNYYNLSDGRILTADQPE